MFRIPSLRKRYILSIRKRDFKLPSEIKRNLMLSDTEKEKKIPTYLHVSSAKKIGRPRKGTTNISRKKMKTETQEEIKKQLS